jgi:hypothetical protein
MTPVRVPPAIAAALMKYRGSTRGPWTVAFAEAHDMLLFVADMGGISGMRPDGTLVGLGWEDQEPTPIVSLRWRDLVVLSGARFYAELQPILPRRAPDDRGCPTCGGTGKVELGGKAYADVVCECGGLGWIPSYWEKWTR